MNKKFLNLFLASLMLASTGSMVTSCNDYDDEINTINGRIDAVEASIVDLQNQIKAGKWITAVANHAEGYELTLSDGTKMLIKHGLNGKDGVDGIDGINGTNGVDGKDGSVWTIVDGYWYCDGKNSGVRAVGLDGKDGQDGKDGLDGKDGQDGKDGINGQDGKDGVDGKDGINGQDGKDGIDGKDGVNGADGKDGLTPFINQDGFWQIGEEVTGIRAAGHGSYIIELEDHYELHVVKFVNGQAVLDEEGKPFTIKVNLPKTAPVSSIVLGTVSGTKYTVADEMFELWYGKVSQDVTFNGITYKQGEILISPVNDKGGEYVLKVNPINVDATKLTFKVKDSFGRELLTMGSLSKLMTDAPLTRAQVNEGYYKVKITPSTRYAESFLGNQYDQKVLVTIQTTNFADDSKVASEEIALRLRNESGEINYYPGTYDVVISNGSAFINEETNFNMNRRQTIDWAFEVPQDQVMLANQIGLKIVDGGHKVIASKPCQNIRLNVKSLLPTGKITTKGFNASFSERPVVPQTTNVLTSTKTWAFSKTAKTINLKESDFSAGFQAWAVNNYGSKDGVMGQISEITVPLTGQGATLILGARAKDTDKFTSGRLVIDEKAIKYGMNEFKVTANNLLFFNINTTIDGTFTGSRRSAGYFNGNSVDAYMEDNRANLTYDLTDLYEDGTDLVFKHVINGTEYEITNPASYTIAKEADGKYDAIAIRVYSKLDGFQNTTGTLPALSNADAISILPTSKHFGGKGKIDLTNTKTIEVKSGAPQTITYADFFKTYNYIGEEVNVADVIVGATPSLSSEITPYLQTSNATTSAVTISAKPDMILNNVVGGTLEVKVKDYMNITRTVQIKVNAVK